MTEKISAFEYDQAAMDAGWDSPQRVRRLMEDRIHQGTVVVDLGIGTGQAICGYAEKGARIIGVDHDPVMLKAASDSMGPHGRTVLADINDRPSLDELDGTVDIVQAVGVLEFAADIAEVVAQVARLLKPGGIFVGTVETTANNPPSVERFGELTVYRHSADEVQALLARHGFILRHDEAYDGYMRDGVSSAVVPYYLFIAQA